MLIKYHIIRDGEEAVRRVVGEPGRDGDIRQAHGLQIVVPVTDEYYFFSLGLIEFHYRLLAQDGFQFYDRVILYQCFRTEALATDFCKQSFAPAREISGDYDAVIGMRVDE